MQTLMFFISSAIPVRAHGASNDGFQLPMEENQIQVRTNSCTGTINPFKSKRNLNTLSLLFFYDNSHVSRLTLIDWLDD